MDKDEYDAQTIREMDDEQDERDEIDNYGRL